MNIFDTTVNIHKKSLARKNGEVSTSSKALAFLSSTSASISIYYNKQPLFIIKSTSLIASILHKDFIRLRTPFILASQQQEEYGLLGDDYKMEERREEKEYTTAGK